MPSPNLCKTSHWSRCKPGPSTCFLVAPKLTSPFEVCQLALECFWTAGYRTRFIRRPCSLTREAYGVRRLAGAFFENGRSVAAKKRQQAGALHTLREVTGRRTFPARLASA